MNKNQDRKNNRIYRWALPILGVLLILFFLPLLAGWEKFFFDDIPFYFYPQQAFLSRALIRGIIPWWNPHLAAGANPFYVHFFQSALSPLNWPFLVLGGLDPVRGYLWLIKFPLAFSFLLSAVFSYLFARRGLRIGPTGSFVFSLAYTLSPAMIYFSLCPPEVFIQAWLPLICLCLLRFSESRASGWLIAGALAFALVSPAGDLPVLIHVIFITVLFGTGLAVLALLRRDRAAALRVLTGGFVIFGLGFLLSGVYWVNMLEGLRMVEAGSSTAVEELSGPAQSMPILYLVTLFIPDFFGGITSHHSWGAAHQLRVSLNDVNVLGGLAVCFLVFAAFLSVPGGPRKSGDRPSPREYWWLFFLIFFFGLLVILGRHTPAYGFFRGFIPVLRMPYPVRLRSIECFALAGLLGVSVEVLRRSAPSRPARAAAVYLIFVLLFAALALFSPYTDVRDNLFLPGFRQLTALGDWAWFISGPVLYLVLAAGLILLASTLKKGKYRIPLLILLATGELLLFSYRAFYHNRVLNHRYRDVYSERYTGPDEHPVWGTLLGWRPEGPGEGGLYRRLFFRSYFDNLSWFDGSLSMLGFGIEPVDIRFRDSVRELTEGFPYEIRVRRWDSPFWRNMSARYLLAEKPLSPAGLIAGGRVGERYAYEEPSALPRVFVMDRVVACSEEEAMRELVEGDLRRGVFVVDSEQSAVSGEQLPEGGGSGALTADCLPLTAYHSFEPGGEEEYLSHFEQLQETNPVTRLDFSNPNRVEIDLEVARPAMLVMTDIWHPGWRAAVDGREVPLHRVNYLQRGVWCRPGKHRVIIKFSPPSLKAGLVMTGFGVIGLLLLIILRRRKDKND